MGMSLSDAIKHCEGVATDNESMCEYNLACSDNQRSEWKKCAKEHRQLAEWLRELQAYRDKDMMLIYANPLAEAVRCAMCTNTMMSYGRGCDGGCRVDEQMYKRVMEAIEELIEEVNNADCD